MFLDTADRSQKGFTAPADSGIKQSTKKAQAIMKTSSETAANFASLLSRMGVTMQASSGLAQTKDEWERIGFQCALSRNGKPFWNGPYSVGLGHVKMPSSSGMFLGLTGEESNLFETLKCKPNAKVKPEYMTVKLSLYSKLAARQKLTPSLTDVMHSLLMDGEASFNGESFEGWCSNYGYDTDSRKAETTWRACMETGHAIRRAFSADEVSELQEASQDL